MTTQTEHAVKCPELEELAAFIDGKLSGAGRDAVVEHLASCEACYEVYTETLRIQEDLGPRAVAAAGEDDESGELAPVVRHPRSFGWAWRAAAAMAAGLVLAVGWLAFFASPAQVLVADPSTIVAGRSELTLEDGDFEHQWPRMRGLAPPLGSTDQDSRKRAFRVGVHAVDLETALLMENEGRASSQTQQIETLLSELDLAQPYVAQCRDLRDDILAGVPTKDLLEASSNLMDLLTEGDYPALDRFYFSFGLWTEKARLAALTGADQYFGEGGFEGFLRRLKGDDEFRGILRRLEKADLGAGVSQEVAKVRSRVESRPIPREDLINALEEIIRLEGVR